MTYQPYQQRPQTHYPDDFFGILKQKLGNVKTIHTLVSKDGLNLTTGQETAVLLAASNDYAAKQIAASIDNLAEAIRARGATRN